MSNKNFIFKQTKQSQKEKVFNYLSNNNTITQEIARELFGVMRLAAVMHDLKKDGVKFYTKISEETGCAIYSFYPFAKKDEHEEESDIAIKKKDAATKKKITDFEKKQKLKAEIQKLKVEKQTLKEEKQALKDKKKTLKEEIKKLKVDKKMLEDEI